MNQEWGIIHEEKAGDRKAVWIDTKKVRYSYKGKIYKYTDMNGFLRRKFENMLFLSRPRELLKIKYQ
jgi:hypothetical protein